MTEVWRLLSIQRHKLRFAKLAPVLLFFIFVTLKPVGGINSTTINSPYKMPCADGKWNWLPTATKEWFDSGTRTFPVQGTKQEVPYQYLKD